MGPVLNRWRDRANVARFALLHVSALAVFVVPFEWPLVWWLAGSYLVRMFGVTAGYHRYFSHRSYKLGRVAQGFMAVLAQTSGQKGVGWHNNHHHCRSSCQQGVRWWKTDVTHLGLRLLAALHIARDLRPFVVQRHLRPSPGPGMRGAA